MLLLLLRGGKEAGRPLCGKCSGGSYVGKFHFVALSKYKKADVTKLCAMCFHPMGQMKTGGSMGMLK